MGILSGLTKYYSLAKGKIYTLIGFVIAGVALKIMYDSDGITQESTELLLTGLMIAGVNHDAIKSIFNSNSDKQSTTP